MTEPLPIAIIGAGPVGLAAAAHAVERGLPIVILEAGTEVAASVRDWAHVRLFSPWRYDVDRAAARLLERAGWRAPPPDALPTGDELFRAYLSPLAALPSIKPHLRLGRRVSAIARDGVDKVRTQDRGRAPFVVHTASGERVRARAVIDATGTWWTPNPLGASGLPAEGESAAGERIFYGIPDVLGRQRARYAGQRVLVVGAGHSAANSILGLAELAKTDGATRIVWAMRGHDRSRVFGGGADDGLPARGRIGAELRALVEAGRLTSITGLRIHTVKARSVIGTRDGVEEVIEDVDQIIVATGQRPDLSMTRELRVAFDPALESVPTLAPLIDPNVHSCGTVRPHGARELTQPEPDYFVIGAKSYGRAPTFLLATGYEQARSVVAMLAGDVKAAHAVELDLPETGVCSSDREVEESCCTPAASTKRSSCC